MDKPAKVHIDFETYSEADLLKVGAWNYSKHPTTEVLWLSVAIKDGKPEKLKQHDSIQNRIRMLLEYAKRGKIIFSGFNIEFETCIIENTLGFGPESIDFNQWEDSSAMAAAMSMATSLAMLGYVLKIPEEYMKIAEGKALMHQLSVPQKCTEKKWISEGVFDEHNTFIRYYDGDKGQKMVLYRNQDPVAMEQYGDYCVGDVESERYIGSLLRPLSDIEREIWVQTMENNRKGLPVDLHLCKQAIKLYIQQKDIELARLKELTNLDNPNSRNQVLGWLEDHGLPLPDLKKETLAEVVKRPDVRGKMEEILQLRHSSAKTPPTKYKTMAMRTDKSDSLFRGAHWYHRATPGREGSIGVNWQNLYRPTFDGMDSACDSILAGDTDSMDILYGGVMETLSSCVRGCVVPSKGRRLLDVDYASIEGRILAWLAGETAKLEIYRTTGLVYEASASKIYQVAMNDVNSTQRFVGKTAELACGFQGGYMSLIGMAARYGIDFESYKPDGWKLPAGWRGGFWDSKNYPSNNVPFSVWFAQDVVDKWRKVSPRTVELWDDVQEAAEYAIKQPGTVQSVGDKLAFKMVSIKGTPYLFMQLPSGRSICYPYPHFGYGKFGKQIQYFAVDNKTHQWSKQSTYGGDMAQSATQGTARDIMLQACLRMRGTVYQDIILKVHDQIVSDVPIGEGSVEEMGAIMCELPVWAKGLPLDFDGQERMRFDK